MKNQKYFWIAVVLIAAGAWFFFHKPEVNAPHQQAPVTSPVITNPAPQTPANSPATNQPPSAIAAPSSPALPSDVVTKYRQGLINKGEAMKEISQAKNETPQDYYGMIIDQNGQPVVGANVTGNLALEQGFDSDEKITVYKTQSDAGGLFQFVGLAGAELGVTVSKEGYFMGGHGEGFKGPISGKTSPYDRAIFTMWKRRGAESLANVSFESVIPNDGTATTFDIGTQKKSAEGDLRVTFSRMPLQVRRSGQSFDWQVKIEMLRGGLIQENDPYPYWAPDEGYEPSFEFGMSSNNVPWHSRLTQDFYVRSSNGQFGLMHIDLHAALTPAKIKFNFTVNPSGSRNLEPAEQ